MQIVGQSEHAVPESQARVLEWTVSLAKERPGKVATVLLAAAFVGAIGYFVAGSWLLGLVGSAVVLGSTSEFLFPIHYRLSEDGARARWGLAVTHIRWQDVQQVRPDGQGVKLSPLPKPSRMEAFRGVYLRFGDRKQEIQQAIAYWCKNDATLG